MRLAVVCGVLAVALTAVRLARPAYVNPGIQQATANVLDRFVNGTSTSSPPPQ